MHPLHFRKCLGRTTLGCRITDLLFAETNPCASHCRTAHRSTYFLQRTVRSSLFPDRIDPPNRAFNAALTRGVWADMVIRVGERACMAVACTLQVWPQVGGHLWLRSRALMLSHQPRSQALPAWGQPADQSCGCHTVHLTFQRSTRHQLQCRVITRRSCRRTHTPYRSNRPSKAPRQVLCISRGLKRPYPLPVSNRQHCYSNRTHLLSRYLSRTSCRPTWSSKIMRTSSRTSRRDSRSHTPLSRKLGPHCLVYRSKLFMRLTSRHKTYRTDNLLTIRSIRPSNRTITRLRVQMVISKCQCTCHHKAT